MPVQFFRDANVQDPEGDDLCCLASDGTVWRRQRDTDRGNSAWSVGGFGIRFSWRREGLMFPPLPQPPENTP